MQGKTRTGPIHKINKEIVNGLKAEIKQLKSKLIFDSIKVMKSITVKIRKKHQCAKCGTSIPKGKLTENTVFRYDNRLVSVYFCSECID